ncbi:MAG: response regulator transcription factor [Bacteroidales bacterium]|nr:response regulator transcription factor [Bacteroidales bacterium]
MKNIILSDNKYISKAGWLYLISNNPLVSSIQEAATKKELEMLLAEHQESLVILDYTLFDFENVNELIICGMRFEKTDWLLFSEELSEEFLQQIIYNTHSFSVLTKNSNEDEIKLALKETLSGNRFICNFVSNLLIDCNKNLRQNGKSVLTPTEREILKEIALGKTTKEIAAERIVSVHTIMTHRKNIFRKIKVNNVHEATKYAMRAGIVNLAEYYI